MTSPARQRAELASEILALLAVMPPGAGEQAASGALGQAVRTVPGYAALAGHLREHPDALVSGSALAPVSLVRFAHALAAAGVPGVALPACAGCGKVAADLRSWAGAGLACQSCYQEARRRPCSSCGATGRVAARGPGGPLCGACYQRDPARQEECARCRRPRRVAYRDADGRPWCARCYPRPARQCAICGEMGLAASITGEGPVCGKCYRRPPRRCGGCGKVRQIQVRARDGAPDLCGSCYRRPDDRCSRCGQIRPRRGYQDGGPVCDRCYRAPAGLCGFCGRLAPITARWESGPVCASCYPKVRAAPVPCTSCGEPRVLTHLDHAGRAICGQCAGQSGGYLCGRCGGPADCLVRGLCSRCALDARVSEVLGEHDTGRLAPIGQALRAADNPKSVLTWLSRSNSARLLASLARHDGPLTHELIDTYPRSQARGQIRQALVHAGVLPPRDELIENVAAWLGDQLRDVPRHHAQLISPFGRWMVLRRARNRARTRTFTEASGSWARQQIRVALNFLTWLDQRGTTLAGLTQPDIDDWLTSGRSQRYTIRYFLRWAHEHRLAPPLDVPLRKPGNPDQILPEPRRWDQLQRCLRDESLSLRVRVAGALLLLYGQPVSRTVQLTVTQITHRDGDTYLAFDQHPVLLPPALARLIGELAATATPAAVLGGRGTATPWLFPGQVPDRHLSANGIVRQLGEHGIQARASRGAALISLAADLPAPVLAGLLGMHVNTAVRWVRQSKRDWASYLAARAETAGDASGEPFVTGG